MARVYLDGSPSPVTISHEAASSVAPMDGHIWVITGGDYDNKEIYDDLADISGMSNKTIIFGKGTFEGRAVFNGCDLYGQGAGKTVLLNDTDETTQTVGGYDVSYAIRVNGWSNVRDLLIRNNVGANADISCALLDNASIMVAQHCTFIATTSDGTEKTDVLAYGEVNWTNLYQQCVFETQAAAGAFSLIAINDGMVAVQGCLMLGKSDARDVAVLAHSMTLTLSNTHKSQGIICGVNGALGYIDVNGVVQDLTAHFESIFNP